MATARRLVAGLALAAALGCGGAPTTYRIDEMTQVEAMVASDGDEAGFGVGGRAGEIAARVASKDMPEIEAIEVGDYGDVDIEEEPVGGAEDGAEANEGGGGGDESLKMPFPVGRSALARHKAFIDVGSNAGSIGPVSGGGAGVVVGKPTGKNGTFVLLRVTMSGEFLKQNGAKQAGQYSLPYSAFSLVTGNEKLKPIILAKADEEAKPSGGDRMSLGANTYLKSIRPVMYKAYTQFTHEVTFNDTLSVYLLFPRPTAPGNFKLEMFQSF